MLNELYNILDLYLVTSRIEGGPQAILECAIIKTPIMSTDVGVASGIFGSFTDSPGNVFEDNGSYYVESGSVFKEELNEINLSFGAEFLYSELFALRAGYFHEHPTKGNRRFISFGAGIKYKVLELDLSYILALTQASPLANTIRFSIKLNMGSSGSKNEE